MSVPAISAENLAIYVFSFNRGQFLDNCLQSVNHCAAGFNTTVIDDQSDDPVTQAALERYRETFRVLTAGDDKDPEHKTGGLYNNMRFAFQDATQRGFSYLLFLQDDMQLVRPILAEDLAAASRFFEVNARVAEIHTCFMKRFYAEHDESRVELDASGEAYLRPSDYQGFSGFSAVGLFSIERFKELFGDLRRGEYANNEYAQKNNIQMGISARPFMMWLPYPISHRGKKRNIPLQIVERLGGCGYHPYNILSDSDVEKLIRQNRHVNKPYAEDWLECPPLERVPTWSFAGGLSNLYARGGTRYTLACLLQKLRK